MRDRKVIISAFAAIATMSLMFSACGSRQSAAATNANANNQPQTVDVTTTPAVVKQIPTYFEATGNLAGDE